MTVERGSLTSREQLLCVCAHVILVLYLLYTQFICCQSMIFSISSTRFQHFNLLNGNIVIGQLSRVLEVPHWPMSMWSKASGFRMFSLSVSLSAEDRYKAQVDKLVKMNKTRWQLKSICCWPERIRHLMLLEGSRWHGYITCAFTRSSSTKSGSHYLHGLAGSVSSCHIF